MITAVSAVASGNQLSLFKSNCGRPNTLALPMAVGSVATSDSFGAINVATLNMAGSPPGGLNSADGGMTYFYTQDGQNNVLPSIQQYNPCNYAGVLAYCSSSILGYDYDYGGGQDQRTYCFAFEESQYCDGATTVRMTGWKVRTDAGNGQISEASLFGQAPNPFTSPATPATFGCKTSHLMPQGLGTSSEATGVSLPMAPSTTCNLCD